VQVHAHQSQGRPDQLAVSNAVSDPVEPKLVLRVADDPLHKPIAQLLLLSHPRPLRFVLRRTSPQRLERAQDAEPLEQFAVLAVSKYPVSDHDRREHPKSLFVLAQTLFHVLRLVVGIK